MAQSTRARVATPIYPARLAQNAKVRLADDAPSRIGRRAAFRARARRDSAEPLLGGHAGPFIPPRCGTGGWRPPRADRPRALARPTHPRSPFIADPRIIGARRYGSDDDRGRNPAVVVAPRGGLPHVQLRGAADVAQGAPPERGGRRGRGLRPDVLAAPAVRTCARTRCAAAGPRTTAEEDSTPTPKGIYAAMPVGRRRAPSTLRWDSRHTACSPRPPGGTCRRAATGAATVEGAGRGSLLRRSEHRRRRRRRRIRRRRSRPGLAVRSVRRLRRAARVVTDAQTHMVQMLDAYVVGQTRAKKVLAVAVYNHYKRVWSAERTGLWLGSRRVRRATRRRRVSITTFAAPTTTTRRRRRVRTSVQAARSGRSTRSTGELDKASTEAWWPVNDDVAGRDDVAAAPPRAPPRRTTRGTRKNECV